MTREQGKVIIEIIMARGPITAKKIAVSMGIDDAEANPITRSMILEAIEDYAVERGIPIVSGSKGYMWAKTSKEVTKYIKSLDGRIKGIEKRKVLTRRALINSNITIRGYI